MERDKSIERSLNWQFFMRWFCLKTCFLCNCCLRRCIEADRYKRTASLYLEEQQEAPEQHISFENQWLFYNDMLNQVDYHLSLKHLASMDKYIKEYNLMQIEAEKERVRNAGEIAVLQDLNKNIMLNAI